MAAVPAAASSAGHGQVPEGFSAFGGAVRCAVVKRDVVCHSEAVSGALGLGARGEPRSARRLPQLGLPQLEAPWSAKGVTCRLTADALRCANRSGAMIVLTPAGVAALGTPAVHRQP